MKMRVNQRRNFEIDRARYPMTARQLTATCSPERSPSSQNIPKNEKLFDQPLAIWWQIESMGYAKWKIRRKQKSLLESANRGLGGGLGQSPKARCYRLVHRSSLNTALPTRCRDLGPQNMLAKNARIAHFQAFLPGAGFGVCPDFSVGAATRAALRRDRGTVGPAGWRDQSARCSEVSRLRRSYGW